jgi:hypothetical protein
MTSSSTSADAFGCNAGIRQRVNLEYASSSKVSTRHTGMSWRRMPGRAANPEEAAVGTPPSVEGVAAADGLRVMTSRSSSLTPACSNCASSRGQSLEE